MHHGTLTQAGHDLALRQVRQRDNVPPAELCKVPRAHHRLWCSCLHGRAPVTVTVQEKNRDTGPQSWDAIKLPLLEALESNPRPSPTSLRPKYF